LVKPYKKGQNIFVIVVVPLENIAGNMSAKAIDIRYDGIIVWLGRIMSRSEYDLSLKKQ
jgi:hypothetical protein